MRVIVICGAGYISGKEKIMLSLINGLKENGDDVCCIISTWGNGAFEELLIAHEIKFYKIRMGFISKTFDSAAIKMTLHQVIYWPKLLYHYKRIIGSFKPDVVIHSNFHHLFLLYPVISTGKIKNIYHNHESINNTKFYRKLFNLFQKKISIFISVSAYVSRKLADLGIPAHKIRTINNGVELIPLEARTEINSIFTIGIAGQVGSWKGHEDLVHALAIVRQQHSLLKFTLYIFGTGEELFINKLKGLVSNYHLDDFIVWKGFVKDIKDIYTGLDVICIPSRSQEPFATSALEAGLFAVPAIVTKNGGFPEIVENGYNGYLVEPSAPEEIAACLIRMSNDPLLARKMGSQHRQVISEKFTYGLFISKWKVTIEEVVETAG